jgi:hypothetical protein
VKGEKALPIQVIGSFGKNKEGVYTYRINTTTKEEIYILLDEVKNQGWKYWETPNIEKVNKTYSLLLKIFYPKELGYPEESSN